MYRAARRRRQLPQPAVDHECRADIRRRRGPSGYGFLSENGDFAEACRRSGVNFVGPRARHIRLMGDKPRARRIMVRAGVPVLPGSEGTGVTELRDAEADAKRLGFPVLIKAAAGGGGKGMRIARDAAELAKLFPLARAESEAAFGSRTMYLEEISKKPATSNSRSWPTTIAMRFTWVSVIVRSSAAIRRCSKRRRVQS